MSRFCFKKANACRSNSFTLQLLRQSSCPDARHCMIARCDFPLPNSRNIREQSPKSPHKFFDPPALKMLFAKHLRSRQKSQTKTMTGFFRASNVRAPKCACLCQQAVVQCASAGSIRSKNMDQCSRSKLNLLSDLADRAWLREFSVSFVCQIYPRLLAQQVPRVHKRHVRSPINLQKTSEPCPMELLRAPKGQTVSKRGLDHLLHLLSQEMFESFRTNTSFYHATSKSLQEEHSSIATGIRWVKASFVAIGVSGVTSSWTVAATTRIGDPFQEATCVVILCQHWQLPAAQPPRLLRNASSRSLQYFASPVSCAETKHDLLRLWGHIISKRHSQQLQECASCGRVCAKAWDMLENDTPVCLTFASARRKLGVTCGWNPLGCVVPAPPRFTLLCRQAFSMRAWEFENGEVKNQKKWSKSVLAKCAGAFSAEALAAGPFDCISRLCGLLLGLISRECRCQAQDGAAWSKHCSTRVRSTTLFLVDFCFKRNRDDELVVQSAQHEGGFGSKRKLLESNTLRFDGMTFGQMLRSAIRAHVNYSLQGFEKGGGSVPAFVFRRQLCLGGMHWRDRWIEHSSLVLVLKSPISKCFQLQAHQIQTRTIGTPAAWAAAQHGLCFTNLTLPNEPTTKLAVATGTVHRLDAVAFCSLFRQKVLQQTIVSRPPRQSKAILEQNSFSKALVLLKMISCAHLGRLAQLNLQSVGHRRGMMNMPMEQSIPIRQFRLENTRRAPWMSGSFVFSKSGLHKAKSTGKACAVQTSSDLTFQYLHQISQRPYDWCFPVWMLCLYKTTPGESLCCFSMQGGFVGRVELVPSRLPALYVASASFSSLQQQHSSQSNTKAIIIAPSHQCRVGSESKWRNSVGFTDSDAHLVICKSCALKCGWLGPGSVSFSKHLGCKALMSCALGRIGVISKTQVPIQATDFSSPFAELLFFSIEPWAFEATLSRRGSCQVDESYRTTMHGLLRLKSCRSKLRLELCIHIVASTVHSKCLSEQILDENLQFHDCNVMIPWNSRNSKTTFGDAFPPRRTPTTSASNTLLLCRIASKSCKPNLSPTWLLGLFGCVWQQFFALHMFALCYLLYLYIMFAHVCSHDINFDLHDIV